MTAQTRAAICILALLINVPAFAASPNRQDPGGYSPYATEPSRAGGPADLYYSTRGDVSGRHIAERDRRLCKENYPTYDDRTGTFVAADGLTYRCQ
ncbi:hypothetical protein [Chelatococcus asaccharovorans]|uniref:hypothetical protein n=1 Tax=Chelatococcus asaccharovorans TaxID=28210 RepID=UPI0022642E2A|nr:hypothetical protein [Chelatococcus asaccharovorans]